MRRSFLMGFVALLPLAGITFVAARDSHGQQPAPPAKNVAPSDRDAASRNQNQPPQVQNARPNDRDISPREQNPAPVPRDRDTVRDGNVAPRDNAPRPNAGQESREREPREATRQPGAREERREGAREMTRRERRTDRDLGISFGRMTDRGLTVSNMTRDSALVRAGLRADDVIVSVNGHRLERADDFDRFVFAANTTDRIAVIVFRGGREEVVYLEPTIFYADESYVDDFAYFGVVFDDRYPDRLIVVRVYPDSPAFLAGIRVGDEMTTFHGQRVAGRAELGRMIHGIEPGNVNVEVSRNGQVVRSQARFNERVAARDRTSESRNERQPADNRNQRQQPGAKQGPQGPMPPNAPQSPPTAGPNRQPGAQPGAGPSGPPPAPPRNAPGARQPMPPNRPNAPSPSAGPGNANAPSAGPSGQQPPAADR
jgi:membrane-associated protease RseP (regulator of RpoE activity)